MVKSFFERYPEGIKRFFEILIPAISWAVITMPIWLSFSHPAVVAYFVVFFVVYWFYKSAFMAFHALRAYLTLTAHVRVDWFTLVKKKKDVEKVHHLVIIPEYKEPIHVLRQTIETILKQDFPHTQISICLATEVRDEMAKETVQRLKKEFESRFAHFWVTTHGLTPGEVAGKSSNMAYAARACVDSFERLGYDLSYITVTSCDADALLHPKYFSYLTYRFLSDPLREFHFYQASIMFYSNIWSIPLPGRVLNTISSIFNLSLLSQDSRLINFSTYTLSLKTAKEVGYWGVRVIPEDYHMFFKTYFHKGKEVRVVPIFLPILVQAAQSSSFWKTLINQYEQQKRWAWGVSDVPEVIVNYFTRKTVPVWDKTMRLFNLLESHIVWPTNWFILTLGSTIPPLINQNFARTAFGHNLSLYSSFILTICIVFLFVVVYLDARSKPPRPQEFARWKIPLLYIQWITLPVVSFFLSALPGLDAHTRLMLGKRLEYRVTEKV
ncbi:glycosyltransferase family 2 protein [Candidatus Roizmanbacteria bacterium]|nr:glycosyltransferase family 2 protein [Candidatus Roizmanbacteria bacterium]